MANKDIIAMADAGTTKHQLGEQAIVGEDLALSPIVLGSQNPDVEVPAINRNFADREQVEIRHEEN